MFVVPSSFLFITIATPLALGWDGSIEDRIWIQRPGDALRESFSSFERCVS